MTTMPTVFALVNQKGGVGKTTTAVTLGHRLALDGHRTLLVDVDPQGHVAAALGRDKGPGLYRLIQWAQGLPEQPLILSARPNLDIIPSDKSTEPAKRVLSSLDFRERVLADALAGLGEGYDAVVIDCAPSVDVLHVAALVAADWIVIPTKLDYLAVDGVREVITSVEEIKRRTRRAPQVLGVLPTFWDRRTNETVAQLNDLARAFGRLVLPPIPEDVRLREAPAYGQTVWEYAPTSRSVVGVTNGNGRTVGGYAQFVERVKEIAL